MFGHLTGLEESTWEVQFLLPLLSRRETLSQGHSTKTQQSWLKPCTGLCNHLSRAKSHLSVMIHFNLSVFIQSKLKEVGVAGRGLLCAREERTGSWVKEKPGLQQGLAP